MGRKFILVGLLMVVFAFLTQDSFVEAGCKSDKRTLRSKWEDKLRERCQAFIDSKDVKVGAVPSESRSGNLCFRYNARDAIDEMEIEFCTSGEYTVSTNPGGACTLQKKHIREKYKAQYRALCDSWEESLYQLGWGENTPNFARGVVFKLGNRQS